MTDNRAEALHPLAVNYMAEIYDKLISDIEKDGFRHLPDAVTLVGLTFTEGLKLMGHNIAAIDPKTAAFLLETSAGELNRVAKVFRDAKA